MAINSVETWTETGTAETVLRDLINDQTVGKRSLPITNTIPVNAKGGQITVSEIHNNLYDVICNYCQQSGLGWKVDFNGEELILNFYETTDISQLVKFDVKYESLKNGEFEESSENYKNVVYVGGQGKGSNQAIYEAEGIKPNSYLLINGGHLMLDNNTSDRLVIGYEIPTGLNRIEHFENQSSLTTEEELRKTGESKLVEYSQKLNFTGTGLEKSPFEFRVNYDIGNIVKVAFDDRNAYVEILSVQESWAFGEYLLEFEFGKPINTLANQINKLYSWLQKYQATNDVGKSGVKYYTIPTDTQQPIEDVTLDVIGFTGTVGSGATFKLYLDDSGTGAKTYHVYLKNLLGSGKLTLTTDKGQADLLLDSGTYVTIIYVDTDGNIIRVI